MRDGVFGRYTSLSVRVRWELGGLKGCAGRSRTVVGRAEMRRVDCSRKDWAVGRYGMVQCFPSESP